MANSTFNPILEVLSATKGDRSTRLRAILASALPNAQNKHVATDGGANLDEAIWLAKYIAKCDPAAIHEPCNPLATL